MIFTSCPECDAPVILGNGGIYGTYAPVDCGECGETLVVEVTRRPGGKTHTKDDFESEVLPDLESVERIDHPSGEATIYADPDEVGVIE